MKNKYLKMWSASIALLIIATALPVMAQTTTSTVPAYCGYVNGLTANYSFGSRNTGVTSLQQFLGQYGFPQPVTGYFGSVTRGYVAQLQRALGISETGFFGPLTREALVRLCAGQTVNPPSSGTVITTLSGPTSLAVNTSGTWTVTTTGPNSSLYSVYVLWGDSQYSSANTTSAASSFSHTYAVAGTYTIRAFVVDGSGRISSATATVVVGTQTIGGLTVTSPIAGQTVAGGSYLTIAWNYPVTPGSASMVIDLYTGTGTKVGTIAINNQTIGSYTWRVPQVPNNLMCTMQYPNGLCGYNLSGQYYIQVSAVSGTGLESNPNVIATGRSGIFTITQGTNQNNQFSASPTSGIAPLTVSFLSGNYNGYYQIAFGDGTSASLLTGTTQHTYVNRGTYTAQISSDALCLHGNPACTIANQLLATVVITVQ